MDLASPANDPALRPAAVYSATERLLARLEALSLIAPTCQAQHAAMYRRAPARPTHKGSYVVQGQGLSAQHAAMYKRAPAAPRTKLSVNIKVRV